MDLIESTQEPVSPAGLNRFTVASRRERSKRYVVTCPHLDSPSQLWDCTCPHFRYRVGRGSRPDSACKHIHAVILWLKASSKQPRSSQLVLLGPALAPLARDHPEPASSTAGVQPGPGSGSSGAP